MTENPQTLEIIERVRTFYLPREKDRGFAARIGIPQTTYSGYTTGARQMRADTLLAISKETGASLQWLITGEGPRLKHDLATVTASANSQRVNSGIKGNVGRAPEPSRPPSRVPIISWVQAGDWSCVADPFHPGDAEEWVNTTETAHPNAFALVVKGDSMEPEFAEGDIITVDPGRAYCSGSFVVVKNGDEATFKQLIIDGSSVFLKPLNDRYPIKDVTGMDIRVVGVVIEKRKRY
jgi:SOS-response transcriptional repressor LexA